MSIKGILRAYSSVGRAMVSKTICHRFDSDCACCGLLQPPFFWLRCLVLLIMLCGNPINVLKIYEFWSKIEEKRKERSIMEKILLGEFKRGEKTFPFNEIEMSDDSFENIKDVICSSLNEHNQDIEIILRERDVDIKDTVYSVKGQLYDNRELYIQKLKILTIQDFGSYRILECFIPEGEVSIR